MASLPPPVAASAPSAVAAAPANAMSGVDIQKIMKSSGPIVKAVVLASDGTTKEILLDTTPQKQHVKEVLGGPFTFLGQYESEGIMLMIRQNPTLAQPQLPLNVHKLQPPFNSNEVRGDILCVRVAAENEEDDEEANNSKSNEEFFLPYTLEEYQAFAARTDVVAPVVSIDEDDDVENEVDEETDEEMEGESDSDDEDEGDAFMEMLMGQVVKRFQEENGGRMPNETEIVALQSAISQKLGGGEVVDGEGADE